MDLRRSVHWLNISRLVTVSTDFPTTDYLGEQATPNQAICEQTQNAYQQIKPIHIQRPIQRMGR